jgi:hypothetical protein
VLWRAFDADGGACVLRQTHIKNLDEYYYTASLFEKKVKSKYLTECRECFLTCSAPEELGRTSKGASSNSKSISGSTVKH